MDVLSHRLWGGIILGRKRRSDYLLAATFSLLPDILGEGVMFSLAALALDTMPSLPLAAWRIHVLIDIPTHSLGLFPTPFLWPLSDFKLNAQRRPVAQPLGPDSGPLP